MDIPTKVYITIDVECAEERLSGGRLTQPLDYELRVWGHLLNQREPLGITFIMDELEARGFRGTFFVEPLGSHSFGMEGLSRATKALRGRGHDVQLHLHPIQRNARWRSSGLSAPSDNVGEYSVGEQVALLVEGRGLLGEAGIPEESIVAFRAGNFGASNSTWEALSRAGIRISSNYNPCYFNHGCRMEFDRAHPGLFRSSHENVWELPISNLVQPNGTYKHLQLTAVSLEDMKEFLWECRRLAIEHATFVTHSFEFYHLDSAKDRTGHPNRLNIARLRGLLDFLKQHSRDFQVQTLSKLARDLPAHDLPSAPYPKERKLTYVRRIIEQGIKRLDQPIPSLPRRF